MKKILLLLFFILSFDAFAGFDSITQSSFISKKSNFPTCSTSFKTFQTTATTGGTTYYYDPYDYRSFKKSIITSTMHIDPSSGNMIYGSATEITYSCSGSGTPICTTKAYLDGLLQCKSDTDPVPDFIPNPKNGFFDDEGSLHCDTGFKDVSGTCYQEVENGWVDDEGKVKCNDGFSNPNGEECVPDAPPSSCGPGYIKTGTNGLTGEDICYPDSDGNGTADIMENNLPPAPDVPFSGVQIDGNGTKRWNVGGNSYELTTDGTLTTTYSDGTKSVNQVGSDYYNSGSSGGTATGGSGSTGNTTNETNPNTNDTPVDDTPASNSCQDSSLTLQEKMLCEMNAGMKKLNSESNTENSLNQLAKDIKDSTNTNATAINTNIKETNKKLDSVKALNENQLAEQKKTNDKLISLENGVDGTNLLLGASNTKIEQIRDNLQDEEGTSYLSKISEFFSALTTPTSDEDKNFYSSQINDKVSSTLSNAFSKYSNVLGFGSTYANRPENITITLFNQEYTLLDFSVFDAYVSIIRSLFLTLAYMYGFMNLIKGSK